jgi:hypothetical protein
MFVYRFSEGRTDSGEGVMKEQILIFSNKTDPARIVGFSITRYLGTAFKLQCRRYE